jgi:hypothetical protein
MSIYKGAYASCYFLSLLTAIALTGLYEHVILFLNLYQLLLYSIKANVGYNNPFLD